MSFISQLFSKKATCSSDRSTKKTQNPQNPPEKKKKQVIQAVPFSSPIVGGHEKPLERVHVFSPSQKGHELNHQDKMAISQLSSFNRFRASNNWQELVVSGGYPPWNLTWNLKRSPWKRRFLLETIIFRFHVKFRGSMCFLFVFAQWLVGRVWFGVEVGLEGCLPWHGMARRKYLGPNCNWKMII